MKPCYHPNHLESCPLCRLYRDNADYRWLWDHREVMRPAPPEEPGLVQKAINYLDDRAEWVAAGRPLVSDEVFAYRRAICDACPDRNQVKDLCRWCGCPLDGSVLGDRLRWGVPGCPAKDSEGKPAPRWLPVLEG